MNEDADSEDDGYCEMELPTLIKQLRSVLDQYPDDGQILKELIQNAEDAEAREVKILFDGRNIQPNLDPKLLRKRRYLAALKAPALCVYNNAQFTEKDWRGIKMLHNSIKEEEPLKVGRFGLGFKSVFHITDIPCIISGDTILFINPERTTEKVCYTKKLQALDSQTKDILAQVLGGTFGFSKNDSTFSGSLFWFPLRAQESKLSETVYTEKKVMDLYNALKAEASITLLFLKSIEEIHLFRRDQNDVRKLFSLKLSSNCLETVRPEKLAFVERVKEVNGKIPASSIQNQLMLEVDLEDQSNGSDKQKWLVINFYKGGDVSHKLRELDDDVSLSYCPYVGLAVPLTTECKGHVFCFLPLPLENRSPTGLALHVNGFFALSQNRRYVKWPTADQLKNQAHTDKAIEWNRCLAYEVLPEVYCNMVQELIRSCQAQNNPESLRKKVYSLLPSLDDVDPNWQPLLASVLHQISNMNILYTQASGGKWISLQDSMILEEENDNCDIISEVFLLYEKNLVVLPSKLLSTLKAHCPHIREVDMSMMFEMLRTNDKYTSLSKDKKMAILRYLGEPQYLQGLQLLPVDDGTFVHFSSSETVYFCEDQSEAEMFPGAGKQLVASDVPQMVRNLLKTFAQQGHLSLALMSPSVFPSLLRRCLADLCPEGNIQLPSGSLNMDWLRQVWGYITTKHINIRETLAGVPLVPDVGQQNSAKLHQPEKLFIAQAMPKMKSLPDLEAAALQKLGVTILRNVPDFVLDNHDIRGHVIHYPTPEGVKKTLENKSVMSNISTFNEQASKQERHALLCYMSTLSLSPASKEVLMKLKIFTDTSNNDCAICTVSTLAPDGEFPVKYPETYVQQSSEACKLALTLGAKKKSLEDVCLLTLQDIAGNSLYSQEQKIQFMDFLLSKHQEYLRKESIKKFASEIKFLTTEEGRSYFKPCQLFDKKDSDLKALFSGEDQFPDSKYMASSNLRSGLQLIGLKTEADLTESDIIQTCKTIEELVASESYTKAEDKIKTVVKVLKRKSYDRNLLSPLRECNCIPRMKQRPTTYPKGLPFMADSASMFLKSSDLLSSHHLQIVGSVFPVAVELPETVEEVFGIKRQPTSKQVVEHLRNVTQCYKSEENHIYAGMLYEIYKFLSAANDLSCQDIDLMQNMNSVWTEDGFKKPQAVYLDKTGNDLNLRPYRFPLPITMQKWKSIMLKIGSHTRQTADMLGTVLQEIKQKHDELRSSNRGNSSEAQQDLQLIIQMIGVLKELAVDQRPKEIYLPTHQDHINFLVLLPVSECTFCNADWLRMPTTDDTQEPGDAISYVHADISENTARQLGVSSLTDRVMDDTEDLDMEYEQSEPLTTRLKNLLREYTDGFSVPKELIQNADDAGATEVCFMYDERQNLNARTFLMHEGMSSLQGPAFWAYNNAKFEKSDFENLKKLSGATKEEDTTKVGKFGLGFNSVYNLTDVPSFISENTVAIFDPHRTHLGRGGLRANLRSDRNQLMLRKMHGQFKPFEGVFGCNFREETICQGTLFRFPLRTQEQADCSEIKKLSYSKIEIENFFQKFLEGCGNLILFTQNVKSVKFFHLVHEGNPSTPELLVHVTKDIYKQVQSPLHKQQVDVQNVLKFINEQRQGQSNDKTVIKERSIVKQEIFDSELTKKMKADIGSRTLPMDITWATGTQESSRIASSGRLKGLVPLAAVAVALQYEGDKAKIFNIQKSPKGFYSEGHLFCFLPLPIKSNLPVHINAGFALTPDRRQLCTMTEDDKTSQEAQWNEALMRDAVSRAYVLGLAKAPILSPEDVTPYYELWPLSGKDQPHLVKGFYKIVIEEEEDVFVFQKGHVLDRTSFGSIRYLDPKLFKDDIVGDIAFNAAEHFWNYEAEHLAKIPKAVQRCFEDAGFGDELKSRCLYELEFFQKIFFPRIADSYWSPEERNKLTLYALDSNCPEVLELVKNVRCIPTKPSGTLKKPCELVHQYGRCHRLFEEDDECFVDGNTGSGFTRAERLKVLFDLGMIRDDLPEIALIERAKTVSILEQRESAKKRFKMIIGYLSYVEYSSATLESSCQFSKYPDEVKQQLQKISFVPILQQPPGWKLPWKADSIEQTFASASELYTSDTANLAGSLKLIIDDEEIGQSLHANDVLCKLGLNQECDLNVDVVVSQLEHFAAYVESDHEWGQRIAANNMCNQLYDFLNRKCSTENVEEKTGICQLINSHLSQKKVILTGGKMVHPEQVAFELPLDLSPYLFKIERLYKHYKNFFITLGVRKTFEIEDILKTINAIQEATGSEKLSSDNLECFGRLMQYLLEILKPNKDDINNIDSVLLPDEDGYLCEISQVCLNDFELIEDDPETMRFVHPLINQRVASWFGVKGKREADLNDDISLLPFGQSEKLTSRLKRILSGYPCDASVMKELLQNADDASATELMFIKDFRTLPNETVVSERWKELQGPALCVYNNSYFSDKDFAGIQNLGEGSKGDDPVKTGQYGVGFNAVYHLTDVPSFMTVGPGTEKTVCALDPHIRYVPWASKKLPGGRITKLDSKRNKYKHFFAGYLEDCMPLQDKGTLFRFPLRTEAMAAESDISQKEITPQEVEKLLEDFKTEMFNSLLFLHCVKKITIAHVTDDGRLVEEYWVESEMNEADTQKQTEYLSHLRTQASNVKDHTTGISIHDISPLETQLSLSVKAFKSAKQEWLIVHRSGFSQDKPLPESLAESWERGDIVLLPRGGVAVPLPSDVKQPTGRFEGKAFCILPLPIETGLPVHVNGHFALDHEARRNLWHGTDDYRYEWNKHTLEAIIIPAYISALQALKAKLECTQTLQSDVLEKRLNLYFGFFPEVSSLPHILWKTLSKCFYKELVEKETDLFPVVKPAEGRFGDLHVNNRKPIQQKVTWVALSVRKGFPGYFNTLTSYYPLEKQHSQMRDHIQTGHRIQEIEDRQPNIRLLTEILRDLGMKVIESPDCVYNYFIDAGLEEEVKVITPEHVISFLKSHDEKSIDKCMIGQLPKNIKDTPLKTITTAKLIIDFVAKVGSFAAEICDLPLAVTTSGILTVFNSSRQLIVSRFSDLLVKVPEMAIHSFLTNFFVNHADDSPSLRPLTLDVLTELLPELLDQTIFMTQQPIPWDLKSLSKTWLSRFWQFLEEDLMAILMNQNISELAPWVRKQLQTMSSWSLFPALHGRSGQLYLYPLTETKKILNLDTVTDEKNRKALQKLNVPVYESGIWRHGHMLSNVCNLKLASHLLGNWKRPGSVLYVLSEVDWTGGCPLKESEAEQLLQHLTRNPDQLSMDVDNAQIRLINLPLYSHISGRLVPLQDAAVVRESYSLVKKGLEEFEHQTGIVLLKHIYDLGGLYRYVNYKPISITQVYSRFLIPQFDCIPSQFRSDHIRFIRKELLKKSETYSDEQISLITQLKALKFIETSDGTLHRACEFYSIKEAVFSTMLPKEAFLPSPYDQDEWHSFLVLLDLHASVTEDDFVEFAEEVERHGSQETSISQELAVKSDVLIKHLWSRDDVLYEGFLWRIRDIKFLLPYHVGHEHRLGETLIKIYPQVQEAKHLICFSESVSYKNCFHVWTSSTMLREEADPQSIFNSKDSSVAYSQLGIKEMPSSHVVAQHVQTVCDSVTRMSREIPIQDELLLDVLKLVMTSIYEYFQKQGILEQVRGRLKTTKCIFLWEEKVFVSPLQVVTDLDSGKAIRGYLYKGPRHFGQFFELFHKFGASEVAKSFHFAQVLNKLQQEVERNELHANELKVVVHAIKHLFTHLESEEHKKEGQLSKIETLYLPNSNNILCPSTELIYCDNSELKHRGKNLKLQYFVGFQRIGINFHNPVRLIDSLPDIHRPKRLTQVLKEIVADSCKEEAKEGSLSRQFSDQIKAPEFISGLVRMINDTRLRKGMGDLCKSDCEKIESDLDNLNILEVYNLHTVLTHKGNILEGSGESKRCWTDHSDNKICIYVASITDSSDNSSTILDLASAINQVTHNQLGKNLVRLSQLIATSPPLISQLLDSWYIHAFDYLSERESKSVFPPPGSIVEEKFHFLLDNTFGYFEEGDYAGFEVYDPVIDSQESVESKDAQDSGDGNDGLFYIYVIIRKVVTRGDTHLQGRYLIEGRDGKMVEVSGTQLYKFTREKENVTLELEVSDTSVDPKAYQSQNLKDVLAEIRRTLRDAWANLNLKERNRVKKRLYLKWHPDKNPDRAEFCTEVCKYIAIYVERLEQGKDLSDDDDVNNYRSSSSAPDFTWFRHFDARSRTQRNHQERYEEEVRNSRRHWRYGGSGGFGGSGVFGGSFGSGGSGGSGGSRYSYHHSSYGFSYGCGGSYHQSAQSEPHAHPMEAKRWYRQAKADLDAAKEALGLSAAYNWICFKCQQAAEKSLKAMLYNCDVQRADSTRTHDLNRIVMALGNPALTDLVSQLENIIKDYNRLRYPDRFSYPTIPADVYTETDAKTAYSLTQKILSLVETSLP